MRRTSSVKRARDDRGVSAVEFALVLPLLLLMIFGIIEASFWFSQQNDIRHGTREGARLAAIDWGDTNAIGTEICARMDVIQVGQAPTITLTPITASGSKGGQAMINVSANFQSLTGYLDWVFGGATMGSTIEFILEQPSSGDTQWWNGGAATNFTCT